MNAHGLKLLDQYARQGAEEAFAALVREYVDLVYSAALRVVHSPQLAEEVAQLVFTDLARQAPKMKSDTLLSAWLYRVTRRTAIDVVRRESRRQHREQIAVELATQNPAASAEATAAESLLDEAMDALPEADRNALLLRFFEGKELEGVGEALGVSEEAARKRVARAVERLRQFFSAHGVGIGSAGIAALLSAHAVQAAPAGLAVTIAAAVPLSGALWHATATLQLAKAAALTTTQKLALAGAVVAILGTGVYEEHRLSQARQQLQALQEQQEPLASKASELSEERDRLAASLQAARAQDDTDVAEVARLRSEVSRLSAEARELAELKAQASIALAKSAPGVAGSETLAAKVALLRQRLEQMPDQKIPELQFADESDWLEAAKRLPTDSDLDVRKGLSLLRTLAKNKVAPALIAGLRRYTAANHGELPIALAQLKPFLQTPLSDAILERYEMILAGNVNAAGFNPLQPVLREKSEAFIDKTYDPVYVVGLHGAGCGGTNGMVMPGNMVLSSTNGGMDGRAPKGGSPNGPKE